MLCCNFFLFRNERRRGILEEEIKKKEKFEKCKAVKDFELMQYVKRLAFIV